LGIILAKLDAVAFQRCFVAWTTALHLNGFHLASAVRWCGGLCLRPWLPDR